MKSISNEILVNVIEAIQQYNKLAQYLINRIIAETQPHKTELHEDADCFRLMYAETRNDKDLLTGNWRYHLHGEHCQFINEVSGQEVEVSLGDVNSINNLDPYFFFRFLETTDKYKNLSVYFEKPFQDILALFEYLEECNILKHIHRVEYRRI